MKKFKDLYEARQDMKQGPKKDTDDEVKDFKPRSKGEEEFAAMHKGEKKDHPVAEPEQHTGDRKGRKTDTGEKRDGPEGKGEGVLKSYKEIKGAFGQSSYRRQDNVTGDRAPVMQGSSKIKEGLMELEDGSYVEIDEETADLLNVVLEELNEENRTIMEAEMKQSLDGYNDMLDFAKLVS